MGVACVSVFPPHTGWRHYFPVRDRFPHLSRQKGVELSAKQLWLTPGRCPLQGPGQSLGLYLGVLDSCSSLGRAGAAGFVFHPLLPHHSEPTSSSTLSDLLIAQGFHADIAG